MGPKTRKLVEYVRANPGACYRLADPSREDRPLYAWTVDGAVATGSLVAWAHDWETGHYCGIAVSADVIQVLVDDGGIRAVNRTIRLRPMGTSDDWGYHRALIRDSYGRIIDAADYKIDLRA